MKPLWVNQLGIIKDEVLKGVSRLVVSFDSEQDQAMIKLGEIICEQISSDFIGQIDNE